MMRDTDYPCWECKAGLQEVSFDLLPKQTRTMRRRVDRDRCPQRRMRGEPIPSAQSANKVDEGRLIVLHAAVQSADGGQPVHGYSGCASP